MSEQFADAQALPVAPGIFASITPRLADTGSPKSMSSAFRRKRDIALRAMIVEVASGLERPMRILDLGGSVEYWRRVGPDFLAAHGVRVEVLNLTDEQLKSETKCGSVMPIIGDACAVDAPDGAYDMIHSNSVIEHVGNWADMKAFAGEVRRLAPNYYVQTPNFWFPVDPHHYRLPMIHWMPRQLAARALTAFPISYCGRIPSLSAAYNHLDHLAMIDAAQMRILFPDGALSRERFCGLTKSLIMTR